MFRKVFKCSIFILSIIFVTIAFAQSPAQILQQQLSRFQTMTANFKQVVLSTDGTTLQKSNGTMAISRPGKFRWETLLPMKQLIITDGKSVWIYDHALQQVVIRKLNQSISQTPILLLTQTHVYLEKSFNIKQIVNKKRGQWFSLTPKSKGEVFNEVILGFQNNQISQMQFSNQLGQKTIVDFSKVKTGVSVPQNRFIFSAPKGVDVVKE